MLKEEIVDVLIISETKLDETFSNNLFSVPNYTMYRCDRNAKGGGIMVFIKSIIPHCHRSDFSQYILNELEGMVFECTLGKNKWLLSALYKPPNMKDRDFESSFTLLHENLFAESQNIVSIGDLNFDMKNTRNKLYDLCNLFGMKNIITKITCNKAEQGTLIDVILVSKKASFLDTFTFDIGVSDHHSLIGCAMRSHKPIKICNKITYRSYRKFSEDAFKTDVSTIISADISSSGAHINEQLSCFDSRFSDFVDKHAPIKQKTIRKPPCPFMNGELRKAIYRKCVLRNNFYKCRSDKNWILYKRQRNLVTKLRKKSVRLYFKNKCNTDNKCEFWSVIKPFYSSKCKSAAENIILREDDCIISNPSDVCESFNEFFTSAANNIGFPDEVVYDSSGNVNMCDIFRKHENHKSISYIQRFCKPNGVFEFTCVTESHVCNILQKLNEKKAMGHDRIPAKLLKICATELSPFFTHLVNKSILDGIFPSDLKLAEVCAIFKKLDRLSKENYRPVSLLRILSKVFERIYSDQINSFFDNIFTPFLSAYRKGFGCHDLLLKFIEQWKCYLDNNLYVGALLIDLSKAFDCLPHNLLICKLKAYGFSNSACKLMASYLSLRKQRVKMGEQRSSWHGLQKGVPQGSIMGPILFNVFIHDLFYFINHCIMFNYADDDSLLYAHSDLNVLKKRLVEDSEAAVEWFRINGMKANPSKFQAIFSHRHENPQITINISDIEIISKSTVTLLGIVIDSKLTFSEHINKLCKQAGKQVNVLRRFAKLLNTNQKLDIYRTFIVSNFNYCPLVWHFCPKSCIRLMEKVNERALRFVYSDQMSSYLDLLNKSNRSTLLSYRNKAIAIQVYKSLNNISPPYLCDLFTVNATHYGLRNECLLEQPRVTTTTHGLLSVSYHGAKIWNSLPVFVKQSTSLNLFKKNIKKINQPLCNCSFCSIII